jgi:diguanylate cyclase (GGDEF)-like protein/PAS domain S-box-containing protein
VFSYCCCKGAGKEEGLNAAAVYLAVAAVAATGSLVLPDGLPRAVAHLVLNGGGAVALWLGLARHRPMRPAAWWTVGAALNVSVLGNALHVAELLGVDAAVTWPANRAAELVAACLGAVATVLFVAVRHPGRDRDALLDAGTVLLAAVLLVAAGTASLLPPDRDVPAVLTVLFVAAVVIAVRMGVGPGKRPVSLWALLLAVLLFLVGNVAIALLGTDPGPPRVLDVTFLLGSALVGAAALHPSMTRLSERETLPERRPTPLRIVALGAALLVNPVVVLLVTLGGATNAPLLVAGVIGLTLLGLARIGRLLVEREAMQTELLHTQQRFRSLVQHAFDVIAVLDGDGTLVYASPSLSALLGQPVESYLGESLPALAHAEDAQALRAALQAATVAPDDPARAEVRLRHADGTLRWGDLSLINRLADPSVQGIVVNLRDITERKRNEANLERLALHDSLTGLPNRASLMQELERMLRSQVQRSEGVALLFVDLNAFKAVNDQHGHAAGDRLLVAAAQRLRHALRPADVLARLGGDEFIVLTPGVCSAGEAVAVADRLHDALSAPFRWPGLEVAVSCSVGIALAPSGPTSSQELIAAADRAMYEAKARGVPTIVAPPPPGRDGAAVPAVLLASGHGADLGPEPG